MTVEAIAHAAQLLQRGALSEARAVLQDVVTHEPGNADALNLLGIALAQAKELNSAAAVLRRATVSAPGHAGAQLNYGRVLRQLGQLADAATCFERAAVLRPDAPLGALKQLGGVLLDLGRFDEAVSCYSQVLKLQPSDAVALHERGFAELKLGQADAALADFDAALARGLHDATVYALRGDALRRLGRSAEAAVAFETALGLDAQNFDALIGLGTVQNETGKFEAAVQSFNRAVAARPGDVAGYLGRVHAARGLSQPAAAAYDLDRVLEIEPQHVVALALRVGVRRELGRREEALADCERALGLAPNDVGLNNAKGILLDELNRTAEALGSFETALAIDPHNWVVLQNLGSALVRLKRDDEALARCEATLRDAPSNADLWLTKGAILHALHRFDDAVVAFDRALAENPNLTTAHFHRALAYLTAGRLAEGFAAYEWRRFGPEPFVKTLKFDLPEPRSLDDVRGKRLLLYREQGLGDVIQFARYARVLADEGVTVSVLTYPSLSRLLSSLGEDIEILPDGSEAAADFAFPLMSAPVLAKTTLASVPARVPYLRSDAAALAAWSERLAGAPGFKVGLAWSGNTQHQADWARTIPFEQLSTLLGVEGVTYFVVQRDVRASDEAALASSGIVDHRALMSDFSETAAFMAALDLVITVDTSVAHLAGALGRPVWVMLASRVDWRWLADRDTSPWYPTARLFRQREPGQWDSVLAEVRAALVSAQKRGDV